MSKSTRICFLAVCFLFSTGVLFAQSSSPSPATVSSAPAESANTVQGEHHSKYASPGDKPVENIDEAEDNAQFKYSPTVRAVAKKAGLSKEAVYWIFFVINFAILAAGAVWVVRKAMPNGFAPRTAEIQKGIEEARRASAEAGARLSEIEGRLAKLDTEIAEIRSAAEGDFGAEEQRIKADAEQRCQEGHCRRRAGNRRRRPHRAARTQSRSLPDSRWTSQRRKSRWMTQPIRRWYAALPPSSERMVNNGRRFHSLRPSLGRCDRRRQSGRRPGRRTAPLPGRCLPGEQRIARGLGVARRSSPSRSARFWMRSPSRSESPTVRCATSSPSSSIRTASRCCPKSPPSWRPSSTAAADASTPRLSAPASLVPEQQSTLLAEISRLTGKYVLPRYVTDPSLIGGVTVRVGSTIYDGSVRGQLQRIRQQLIES